MTWDRCEVVIFVLSLPFLLPDASEFEYRVVGRPAAATRVSLVLTGFILKFTGDPL